MTNELYLRKVSPFLKEEYFETKTDRILLGIISKFFDQYNTLIGTSALKVELNKSKDLSESEFKAITQYIINLPTDEVEPQWLLDNTEAWCKKRAVLNGIMESISILEGRSKDKTEDAIPTLLQEALAVCFDTNIGHDYLEDAALRYINMHLEHSRIPFDIDLLNKITKGGLIRKTLNASIAETGAGKSAFMCHLAASTIKQGFNVLYISMEMSEESVAERIDANMMRTNINDLSLMPEDTFMSKIEKLKDKTEGKLIIKQYPTSSAHAGHFRALIEELKTKKNFKADLVIIDYLGICASSRIKMGGSVNTNTYIRCISEELRGLAIEQDVAMWTAVQANRGGISNSDLESTDTAESIGLVFSLDLYLAQMAPEELKEMNQMMFKQLKNRYNDPDFYKRFVVGFDRPKMNFYNLESSAQEGIDGSGSTKATKRDKEDKPIFDSGSFGSRMKERKDFGNFNFD